MDVNPEAMAFTYVLVSGWWTWIGHQARHQDFVPKGTMKLVVLGQEVLGTPLKPWAKCKVNDRLRLEMVGNFCRFLLPSQVMMGTVSKWRFPKSRVYPYSYHFFIGFSWILHLSSILAEYSTINNPSQWDFPYIIFPFQTIHFGVPHDYGPRPL